MESISSTVLGVASVWDSAFSFGPWALTISYTSVSTLTGLAEKLLMMRGAAVGRKPGEAVLVAG